MPSLTAHPDIDRRSALRLLATSAAAIMARCSRPDEEIIPYADMPEGLVAGEPMRFATTLLLAGFGRGFLGISVDGRPIKIEGNPRHPFSLGATDIFAEAEVLSLYDPDRSTVVLHQEQISTWGDFAESWERAVARPEQNRAMAIVTGRIVSPTTLSRLQMLQQRFTNLRWYRYEPVNDDASRAGARLAFGRVVSTLPRWADADVILSLGADPLGHGPDELRIARAYSSRRGDKRRQQIHVAESCWTLTGAAADFRMPLRPEEIREVARAIANGSGANLGVPRLPGEAREFVQRAGRALAAAKGRALVLVGEEQAADLHALGHWLNAKLGAPIDYLPPQDPVENDHAAELAALASDLHEGRIGALVVADANPVYDAPDKLRLPDAIASLPFSIHIGRYRDETAACCRWHLPLSHVLESWGDARAPDGTASLVQPLIQRLYDTRTADEILALLAGQPGAKAYDLVRETWRSHASSNFETWWRTSLEEGLIAGSAASATSPASPGIPELPFADSSRGLMLLLSPDRSTWDGRLANNAWLQECPQPFTRQVWGNAVQIAPGDAERLGIADESTVEVEVEGRSFAAPAILMPGQADGVIGASWGQGRVRAGRIGTAIGARTFGLAAIPFARVVPGARLQKTTKSVPFRSTQAHTRLEGRAEDLFPIVVLSELAHHQDREKPPPSLLAIPPRGEYAWAMVIDNDACIGCNACVVACQAENNVPVVGPAEVSQGRDMHWLRVDSYVRPHGYIERRGFEPVPCMHCELAPCEPVCPVEASVHDREGLNVQVYNRCIGTRFCEANCPYKVRRFNWFAYAGDQAYAAEGPALRAQHNPDVSVRERGVMEKCNYCLQRISRARKNAEKQDRRILEGEMVTACQAACPTRAIHFGDLNSSDSEVSRLRRSPRHFTLLAELNTRPRTTYLKRIYNVGDEHA